MRLMDWASHRATASSVRVQHQAPKGAPISEVMGENDVMLLDESAFIASRLKALSQLQRSDLACGHGSAAESPPPTALCSRATTEHESEHDSGNDKFMTPFVSTQHFSAHVVGSPEAQLQEGERFSTPVY